MGAHLSTFEAVPIDDFTANVVKRLSTWMIKHYRAFYVKYCISLSVGATLRLQLLMKRILLNTKLYAPTVVVYSTPCNRCAHLLQIPYAR